MVCLYRISHGVLALAFCLVLVACSGDRNEYGDLKPNPAHIPLTRTDGSNPIFTGEYTLVDGSNQLKDQSSFQGKIAIIYFGFTSCPDVCPLALGRLSAALDELDPSEVNDIAPIFITVDPKRDTPELIKEYLSFDDRLIGLSGDENAVKDAAASFKVYADEEPLEDSAAEYTVNHSSLFYLVDRQAKPLYALRDNMEPADLAATLRQALAW